MRVAIYARVSTADQSCERQISDLKEFAGNRKDQVIAVFCEKASGTKNNRVERDKVITLARQRKIDAILVTEMSRWGRNTVDLLQTIQQLADWKVSVIALSGALNFDMATAQGKLMVTLLSGFAEFERNLIVERVKSGLAHARSKGKILGRRSKASHYEIISSLAAGKSIRATALELGVSKTTVLKLAKEHRRQTG
jgi:putative DNA-invertase from lambdoid prophage Rac